MPRTANYPEYDEAVRRHRKERLELNEKFHAEFLKSGDKKVLLDQSSALYVLIEKQRAELAAIPSPKGTNMFSTRLSR